VICAATGMFGNLWEHGYGSTWRTSYETTYLLIPPPAYQLQSVPQTLDLLVEILVHVLLKHTVAALFVRLLKRKLRWGTHITSSACVRDMVLLEGPEVETWMIISTNFHDSLKQAAVARRKLSFEISRARLRRGVMYSAITSVASLLAKESRVRDSLGNTRTATEPLSVNAFKTYFMNSSIASNASWDCLLHGAWSGVHRLNGSDDVR